MTDTSTDPAPADEERGWSPRLVFSLASIVLVLELLSVSYTMIAMALPSITAEFDTLQGAWLMTAFLLVGAVTAPLTGKLADLFGKRRVMLLCVTAGIAGSVLSATATSYAMMIAGRAIAGLLVPTLFLSYSLIRDVYPRKTIPLAVSICTAGMGMITVAAPFLSGWFIDGYGWRSLFWFFAVVLAVLLVLITISTPETPVRLRARMDFIGAALLGAGLAGLLIAVSFGPEWGWSQPSTLAYLFGGAALVAVWWVSSKKIADPLIRRDVLLRRPVLFTVIAAGAIYSVGAIYSMVLPMMTMASPDLGLGYGFGVDAEGYALFQVPLGGMTMVGGLIVGVLCGRGVPTRILMASSMLVAGAGAVLTAIAHDDKALLLLFAGMVGLGIGLGYAAIPNVLVVAAPPELQASTASIAGVVQSLFSGAMPVVAFTVMNNSFIAPLTAEQTGGAVAYTDGGYVAAFIITAITAVVGVAAAMAVPRRIEQVTLDSPVSSVADGAPTAPVGAV